MQINEKSVWQLCLEIAVDMEVLSSLPTTTRAKAEKIKAHLDAYLEAATPPDVAGLLTDIENFAWNCDEWPDWLHDVVEKTNEVSERLDMSAEQARAYAALSATALRLSACGGVPSGWYCSAGEHHTLLYTLRQDGWRKGKPVMANDVTIRVEKANGSQKPIEPIVRLIMDAVNASPTVEAGR